MAFFESWISPCLSLFRLAIANTTHWIGYNQQNLFLTVLEAGESNQCSGTCGVCFIDGTCLLCPQMAGGPKYLSGALLWVCYSHPCSPTLWSKYFPTPLLSIASLGIRMSTCGFWGNINIQAIFRPLLLMLVRKEKITFSWKVERSSLTLPGP